MYQYRPLYTCADDTWVTGDMACICPQKLGAGGGVGSGDWIRKFERESVDEINRPYTATSFYAILSAMTSEWHWFSVIG